MKISIPFNIGDKVYYLGTYDANLVECSICKGTGTYDRYDPYYGSYDQLNCSICHGWGQVNLKRCNLYKYKVAGPIEIIRFIIAKDYTMVCFPYNLEININKCFKDNGKAITEMYRLNAELDKARNILNSI